MAKQSRRTTALKSTTVPAKIEKPADDVGFTIKVWDNFGPFMRKNDTTGEETEDFAYRTDMVLSRKPDVVRFVKLFIANERSEYAEDGTPIRVLDDAAITYDDGQILSACVAVSRAEKTDEEWLGDVMDLIASLSSSREAPMPDLRELRGSAVGTVSAIIAEASRSTNDFDKLVMTAIEGRKVWEGGPIVMLPVMQKIWGDDFATFPLVGSWPAGATDNKGKARANTLSPKAANMQSDHFKGEVNGDEKSLVWWDYFVENLPHVRPLVSKRKVLLGLAPKSGDPIIPAGLKEAYPDIFPLVYEEQEVDGKKQLALNIDRNAILGIEGDLAFDIQNYKNRVKQTARYWQKVNAIIDPQEPFIDKGVQIELSKGTPELTARSKRPIIISGDVKSAVTGTTKSQSYPPMPLSTFLRIDIDRAKQNGGTASALIASTRKPRVPGGKTAQQKKAQAEAAKANDLPTLVGKIEKTETLLDVLSNVSDYTAENYSFLSGKLSQSGNGALASEVIRAIDCLTKYDSPALRTIAKAFDNEQAKATAAQVNAREAAAKAATV